MAYILYVWMHVNAVTHVMLLNDDCDAMQIHRHTQVNNGDKVTVNYNVLHHIYIKENKNILL